MKTDMRQAIIAAAKELFTRRGCKPITTNHIIARLGISPGTFYYHFRNKEEILRAVFDEIVHAFNGLPTAAGAVPGVEAFARYITEMYKLYGAYRFFFIDIAMLLAQDPLLAEAYRKNAVAKRKTHLGLLRSLEAAGILLPFPSPADRMMFLHHLWMITDFWFSYHVLHRLDPEDDGLRRGLRQFFFFIKPYLQPACRSPLSLALRIANSSPKE